MSSFLRAAAICTSVWVAGCAIHPLPEDVTGVSTYHIVRQIRCEAREAIISSATGWLSHQNYDLDAQRIGIEFAEKARPIETFHYNLFRGKVRAIIKLFYDTGIAYNYTLTITEENDLSTTINLLKPFRNSVLTASIGGGVTRQRTNTRTFTVTDTFSHLIRNIHDDYCQKYIVAENHIYPITGKIGMDRVIHDFINLTLFGNLAGDPKVDLKGPPTLADQLDFQTTLSLSAAPKLTFSPIGTGLSVTDATISGSVSRKDDHQVIVGLAINDASLPFVAPVRSSLFTNLLTVSSSGTNSERAAAFAADQLLTRKLFSTTVVVTQ